VRTGGNNGLSGQCWDEAYETLDAALSDLHAPNSTVTTILIAGGTYRPANASSPFQISVPVTIRGGYKGTGAAPDTRDLVAFETTISGDLGNNDAWTLASMSDNARRLFEIGFPPAEATFDGLTFKGGNALLAFGNDGGAIRAQAPVIVEECIFRNNAGLDGGAIVVRYPHTLKVARSSFEANGVPPLQPGDYEYTGGAGGAISAGGSMTVVRSNFSGNRLGAGGSGGAIYAPRLLLAETRIVNSTFFGNSVGSASTNLSAFGGAVYALRAPLDVTGCVFAKNTATGASSSEGGAIGGSAWTLSQVELRLCTVADNVSSGTGGGVASHSISCFDSIAYGNTAASGTTFQKQLHSTSALWTIEYSCVQGLPGSHTVGNISSNPNFVSPSTNDYSLLASSPAIDVGANALIPADVTDVNQNGNFTQPLPEDVVRNERVMGCVVDMGAYEHERCAGDANHDGFVNGADIAVVLGNWGLCSGSPCAGDLDCSGTVDGADMAIVLGNWGSCGGELAGGGDGAESESDQSDGSDGAADTMTPSEAAEAYGFESVEAFAEWLSSLEFEAMSALVQWLFGS